MEAEILYSLNGRNLKLWKELLEKSGLFVEDTPESTVLVWDGGELIATGSRKKNLLKYIAVSESRQGEDLTATVISNLRQDAFAAGYEHLFLYTKPKNRLMFTSLFFYPVVQTDTVLLMESEQNGIKSFLSSLPALDGERIGAAVMNCNPFTNGHRHLAEKAAAECDRFYIFVLSEESPPFTAADRFEMVKRGVSDIKNVTVYPSGPYLISSATFPTYFLKDRDSADSVKCDLDIKIFGEHYAPYFNIKKRFVGTEPLSQMTEKYNLSLEEKLPAYGIELATVERFKKNGTPVSATEARAMIESRNLDRLKELVPETTYSYLKEKNYI